MQKYYYVYILASKSQTLYIGVTGDLERRVFEHKISRGSNFTKRYSIHKLVYYETFGEVQYAIAREKQLKGYRRQKKLDLIEENNPDWSDISIQWFI